MKEIAWIEDYRPAANLLEDRIVLVTGAGDGIGAALSRTAAGLGATVVLLGRTTAKLEKVYDEIVATGAPEPGIFVMDLETAGPEQYDQLATAVEQTYGRLDGLVHNAGILGERTPIEYYDVATWQRVLHVNLTAPFILTRALFPLLRQSQDASVIFTSSGVGRSGRAFWGAYSISKFGTEGLMEILADEVGAGQSLRFNAVNPGPTRTAMRAAAYPGEDPAKLSTPEEILSPYLFLLGPDSRDVNGASYDAQPPDAGGRGSASR
jgi:NAD(P)-dependent dehydrogenase (short-subunit alcohol dehydrogenase family)